MDPIHYSDTGKGHPVVLIHGFCESGRIWDHFAENLETTFRILIPDLPGFGKSPLPATPFTISEIASAMIQWIHEIELHDPVVIGHSLGGYVTLAMVDEQPELFRGFGLFHSTAYADTQEKKENRNKVIDFVNRNGVQPYVETYVPGLFYQKGNPFIEGVHGIASRTASKTLTAYALAMRDRPSTKRVLETFPRPVLIIAGEQDSIIPFESASEQSQLLKFPFFRGLTSVGHMGMFEAEPESIKIVKEFVNLVVEFKT